MAKNRMFIQKTTKTVVDPDTGEIQEIDKSKIFILKNETDPFWFTYSKCIGMLYGLKSLTAVKIMWKFMETAHYNTGEILVPSDKKKRIIEELGISLSVYNKSVALLVKTGIFTGKRGMYRVNPQLHWKGDYRTRDRLVGAGTKISIEPDCGEFGTGADVEEMKGMSGD